MKDCTAGKIGGFNTNDSGLDMDRRVLHNFASISKDYVISRCSLQNDVM